MGCRGNEQLADVSVEIRDICQCRIAYSVEISQGSYGIGTAFPTLVVMSTRFVAQCKTNRAQIIGWADLFA